MGSKYIYGYWMKLLILESTGAGKIMGDGLSRKSMGYSCHHHHLLAGKMLLCHTVGSWSTDVLYAHPLKHWLLW